MLRHPDDKPEPSEELPDPPPVNQVDRHSGTDDGWSNKWEEGHGSKSDDRDRDEDD